MAIMIPEKPRDFDPASLENLMFDSLASLSDDYYIFHSFRITVVKDNTLHESETDFVIFNKNKGIICLEAKAGNVRYQNGSWLYSNGIPMHHGGPFNQASSNKYKLMKYIEDTSMSCVLGKCKFLHAVWFPSVTDAKINSMILPSEADRRIILTQNALTEPERYLDRVYSVELLSGIETDLSEAESQKLIREVLCPQFNVFPAASFDSEIKKIVFHRLLKEQAGILNFLVDQKTAAINGAAGTGKTMIALEKAQRHASLHEKVLFLCFNVKLKEYLQRNYPNEFISFFTVAGFACSLCGTTSPDYNRAKEVLEDMYITGSFPYSNIIIDEGQDFGNESIEEADIIELLLTIVTDRGIDGSFYVFYDKLQMVQAKKMPAFIDELDCKLTLYRNCRNTENIALTSLRPISERIPKVYEGAVKGVPAKVHFCNDYEDAKKRVDIVLNSLIADGLKDIVILTCKNESNSCLSSLIRNDKYRNKYLFTSCRKFKGLEADAVILIDVDNETFTNDVLLYYVGTSRARIRLDVITTISDDECRTILKNVLHYNKKIGKPKKDLAGALNALGSLRD